MNQESHFVDIGNGEVLHLKRIYCDPSGPPVFMIHGAIENGRIFYSDSGKGLAPYLASQGYDTYVADLRGRGLSRPLISRSSRYGQTETITEDIPAFVEYITSFCTRAPEHWIAHSWGGVLLSSCLARFPEYRKKVASLVYFGTKRSIRAKNIHTLLKSEFVWKRLCKWIVAVAGWLPAKQLGIGSDNETKKSLLQCIEWVNPAPWIDPEDGFDYGLAASQAVFPPIWYIAAENDHALGHPDDVRDFMNEAGSQEREYTILSLKNGNHHNYNHISMLTHPDAVNDHFPAVLEWLKRRNKKRD